MKRSWIDKKSRICTLIKLISERDGGDDKKFLDEYTDDVIKKYKNNLDEALACFENLYKN
jgi:hypothetical protein